MAKKAFFLKRLNDHVQYLKKIDAAIKGESDFQGTPHRDCQLGQWLYDEGGAEVAAMENSNAKEVFESLLEPHERFHTISKEALEKKRAGDEAGAQAILTEMHVLSTLITNKLLELDGMR
ncbi:MAG: hypothetical protein DRR08_03410 [Candidatus Parabeggiatoa sp. nov. 2]|nr:MAG: hypothetical protein B6247_20010 [Beggiatoa sp. 4572_84]RKZ63481.1 MAG: hypothetical protein DRR08_03410 [Gammaproteobacteria bacterium]HEC85057.1 hypothetical protein [Thioploca sp.]